MSIYTYINILDNLFYFVLSFYDFIYMLFTVFIYTPRNIILQYATHARFIYWQVGLNRFKLHLQAYLLGWEITCRSTFLYFFFALFLFFIFFCSFIILLFLRDALNVEQFGADVHLKHDQLWLPRIFRVYYRKNW